MQIVVKNLAKLFALCSCVLLLASCGPVYQTTYSYKTPRSQNGRYCANACLQDKSRCEARCREDNQYCRSQAQRRGERAYRRYVRDQRRAGKPVNLNVDWFTDYSGCNNSCGCTSNYNQCFTNCGGTVVPHTVCVAFCKDAKK